MKAGIAQRLLGFAKEDVEHLDARRVAERLVHGSEAGSTRGRERIRDLLAAALHTVHDRQRHQEIDLGCHAGSFYPLTAVDGTVYARVDQSTFIDRRPTMDCDCNCGCDGTCDCDCR